MVSAVYWSAAIAFFAAGVAALVRPKMILDIRSRFRPNEIADTRERRRTFGLREVRICGVALLIIDAALVRSLMG